MNKITLNKFIQKKYNLWSWIWVAGILLIWIWNILFLNKPAFVLVERAFLNTFMISFLVVIFSFFIAWFLTQIFYFVKKYNLHYLTISLNFLVNLVRSIPQILGVLILYIILTYLIQKEIFQNEMLVIIYMSLSLSIFIFPEVHDLLQERIEYFIKSDFFNAMLVCGIKDFRIINNDILLKNSLSHILNKIIAIFGSAIFIQCSVDFILSIGLSTEASSVNFPATLGSLLAKIDSKQDILAISHTITNPVYFSNLFFNHLQGITIAVLIVFSLLCVYKITVNYAEEKGL